MQSQYTEISCISIHYNFSKGKVKKTILFTIASKIIKYLGINLTKEMKDLYSENYTTMIKKYWRRHKQMGRYTMFLDWKNQYCENAYTPQSNLQIQCNPYQITNGIFHVTRTQNLYENIKDPNSQSNLEKEKRSWRNQAPWLQTILQSYSHQNSMGLA